MTRRRSGSRGCSGEVGTATGEPGRRRAGISSIWSPRRTLARSSRSAHATEFRQVFGLTEFRALWAAQLLSVAGDQLARVALTVLVYERTGSALLAATAYAATIAPVFVGGVLLRDWLIGGRAGG